MAGFFLSQQEQELLRGTPELVQRLYVLQLRPRMDIDTKLVGKPPYTISWASIARFLGVDPAPGIKAVAFSTTQLRRACDHLIRLGLVVNHSRPRQLLLELPLAMIFDKADRIDNAKADRLYLLKADRLKHSEDTELADIFAYLDGKADILIDVKPDCIEAIKPDCITVLSEKADSLKQGKADQEIQPESPVNTMVPANPTTTKPTGQTTQKPTAFINTVPDQTLPNLTLQGQMTVGDDAVLTWRKFFKELGFNGKRLQNIGCRVMYKDWSTRGITQEMALECIEIAQSRLGQLPDTPEYLKEIMDEYIAKSNEQEIGLYRGYESPISELKAYEAGKHFAMVVAPSDEEADRCMKVSFPAFTGKLRRMEPNEYFYLNEEQGDVTIDELIAHWVSSGLNVPGVKRWQDG